MVLVGNIWLSQPKGRLEFIVLSFCPRNLCIIREDQQKEANLKREEVFIDQNSEI